MHVKMHPFLIALHFLFFMMLPKGIAIGAADYYRYHDRSFLYFAVGSLVLLVVLACNLFRTMKFEH